MKRSILLLIFVSLLLLSLQAQNLIAVQNGGNPTFYSNLDSAILYAQNGDTLCLPGGTFYISDTIDKRIHIIGVGHVLDSNQATGKTSIIGNIILSDEASGGSLVGVDIHQSIHSGEGITDYLVLRSRFNALESNSLSFTNWSFIENVIQGGMNFNLIEGTNCFFSNNIIDAGSHSFLNGFTLSNFKNNVFLNNGWCNWGCVSPIKASYSNFENNVFISQQWPCCNLISNSSLNNNLFIGLIPLENCSDCWGINNIIVQSPDSIFINQTGTVFNYAHDYHLQPTSAGKNAGSDGTDVGIYGGAFPWKDGSLPQNPHIQHKFISGGTDQNGNLNVNIKVDAQDH